MVIWLPDEQAQIISCHVLADSPYEACGIIGGVGSRVYEVIPTRNIAANPENHYQIDERDLTNAMFKLQNAGMSLIGFYHSHPTGDFRPSLTDIEHAYYHDTAYVIVGLSDGTPRMAAWQIKHREVTPIEIHVGFQPPDDEPASLSQAQKVAIIASALLAFVFMIVLSLSLLPPAPPIP